MAGAEVARLRGMGLPCCNGCCCVLVCCCGWLAAWPLAWLPTQTHTGHINQGSFHPSTDLNGPLQDETGPDVQSSLEVRCASRLCRWSSWQLGTRLLQGMSLLAGWGGGW